MDSTRFRRTKNGNYFAVFQGRPCTVFRARSGSWGFFLDGDRGDAWFNSAAAAIAEATRRAMEPAVSPCFLYFGLQPPFTREALLARYRELAVRTHPDRGGSAEEFKTVQSNFEAALGCLEASR